MKCNIFFDILSNTAWQMEAPALFGAFHITAALLAAAVSAAAAAFFARRIAASDDSRRSLGRVLFTTGIVLAVLEIYKQLFLFHIVNGGAYDWWFFPFQLCSVPMYLCILFPFVKGRLRSTFLTFMSGYTFVSAAAALIYPEDILRPYLSLTVHGFLWHGILLFISLLIMLTGSADASPRGLLRAACLFALLCIIAVCINAAAEPVMQAIRSTHPQVLHSWTAMFYLNPYHLSPQPLVGSVQKTAGIPAGLVLYAIAVACFSSLICKLSCREQRYRLPRK
jgi:uncharacterized membrane protein YwaF